MPGRSEEEDEVEAGEVSLAVCFPLKARREDNAAGFELTTPPSAGLPPEPEELAWNVRGRSGVVATACVAAAGGSGSWGFVGLSCSTL